MTGKSSPWLVRFTPEQDAAGKLVCLPHAGGSATFFRPVAQALSPALDVVAVQYPGRQDRRNEPGITDLGELADHIVRELRPLAGPALNLFGHSMGAILAFEVAQRLEADGAAPAALFVSGRRAPSRHRDNEWAHLKDNAALLAEMSGLGGTDSALLNDPEIAQMILPATRSDLKAVENYRWRPGPKLSCPVFAFVGDDDPRATIDEARAWAEHTSAEFELSVFPGGHFYLIECGPKVIDMLRERIAPVS